MLSFLSKLGNWGVEALGTRMYKLSENSRGGCPSSGGPYSADPIS